MKKILLALTVLFALNSYGQNCVPDGQYTSPGVYPDSATNLPISYVGSPYNETITAVTPADTCVVVLFPPCTTVPIDSVMVTSVTGLPAGFTIVSMNENTLPFKFLGGTSSCMLVTGNPTVGDTGVYPISVSGTSYATVFGLTQTSPFDVDYYSIRIIDTTSSTTGIEDFSKNTFGIKQNFPNPFSSTSTIEYYLPSNAIVNISIVNVLGEVLISENLFGNQGLNTYKLNASKLNSGIYFYQMTYQKEKITKRFIVNK